MRLVSSTATALVVLLFSIAPSALPATEAPAVSAEKLSRRIDAYVAPLLADRHLSGRLVVAREGAVVYQRSFGLANLELGVPVDETTRFNVASITKPMTGIVAVSLIEQGKLELGGKLSDWLPGFPRSDEITIEHLLRHQSGIPHRVTTEEQEALPRTSEEMVQLAAAAGLEFDPGSRTSYSSGGYSVLARVLELAGGMGYAQLLDTYVFRPAGMTASLHPQGSDLIPGRASSYLFGADGRPRNATPKSYSFLVGAGSVFSTADDLQRLVERLIAGGFGDLVTQTWVREGNVRFNGRTNGFRAFADYHAASEVTVVLTSNLLTGAGDLLRRDVPRLAAGEDVAPPPRLDIEAVDVPLEVLRSYEGVYRLREGMDLEMRVKDGSLDLQGWTLIATSATTFFSPQDYGRVTVVEAGGGGVERLDWQVGEEVYPMPRVGD